MLKLYGPDMSELSSGNDILYPLVLPFDGTRGGAIVKQLFVRNDNIDRYYTDIILSVIDSSSEDRHLQINWYWKLIQSSVEPANSRWITATSSVSIPDIGTSLNGNDFSYTSVFLRVETPAHIPAQIIENIGLQLTGKEHLVGY